MVFADHGPNGYPLEPHVHPHGHHHVPAYDHPRDPLHSYGPQIHCGNTTNVVTAKVCVPVFTEKVTPITLAVKEVQDNEYLGKDY